MNAEEITGERLVDGSKSLGHECMDRQMEQWQRGVDAEMDAVAGRYLWRRQHLLDLI